MRRSKDTYASTIILGLLFFGIAAFAQDTIQWERGRAVCVATYQWDASTGGTLKVDVSAMDVSVNGDNSDKIVLTEKIVLSVDNEEQAREYFEMYRVQLDQSGDRYHFETPKTRKPYRGGSLTFNVPHSFNVQVTTSAGDLEIADITGTVRMTTSAGDVDVKDIAGITNINTSAGDITASRVEGNLTAETSGGDIYLSHCSPEIAASTSGGDIEITHGSGVLNASTSGGDIEFSEFSGSAKLSTSGGDIEISDITGAENVNATTSGGDIGAQKVIAGIALSTSSGDIQLRAITGQVEASTSNGDISGTNIEGQVIKASTSSGDIDLQFVSGDLRLSTSNGDLTAKLKKSDISYEAQLSSSNGDVVCLLPNGYKVSVNAKIRNWSKNSGNDISSDFKLKVSTEDSNARIATGDINGGGPLFHIETTHGDISIERY